jgi:hypothetical protein
VVSALDQLQVTNNDRQRDGFQMTFLLGRRNTAEDYGLLHGGVLDPPRRVSIMVILRGRPEVLINGIITQHQVVPSHEPGRSQLIVTGEDTGLDLDLEEKSHVFRNLSDSNIVNQILGGYRDLQPLVTPTTQVVAETEGVTTQQVTDLAFIRQLSERNSFVFYTEPSPVPGQSIAYWGPKERPGELPQVALSFNMGSDTNVDQLSFNYNALQPVTPTGNIFEPQIGTSIPIPVPNLLSPSLSQRPAEPMRTTIRRDTANLSAIEAALRLLQSATEGADAVRGTGELDAARYGHALRARRKVGVRGAGESYDGTWYVATVTHRLQIGQYKQSFTLTREGLGASSRMVRTR